MVFHLINDSSKLDFALLSRTVLCGLRLDEVYINGDSYLYIINGKHYGEDNESVVICSTCELILLEKSCVYNGH